MFSTMNTIGIFLAEALSTQGKMLCEEKPEG